ncbi:hypothetical protein [Aquisalinus flavus]|uniref:Uncharacterized protein n=1 Tax=Aquisalinus flavus TaxID=1526572 RepID=A0A8J2V5K6_9PROT|nr:hypothetical protein [Aquisalinus flavus]MBD0427718.1 hypothetical protein [Aquisalinus flavus]UNE47496.1 hypothetical protein FF099_05210 [Aquisalinus flavus]GGD03251.1 hypothetical protein GCM10011342_10330 [Aquisalinus flavus]
MLLVRIATAFFLSLVNLFTTLLVWLLPLAALLLAQTWLPLEFRDWPILLQATGLIKDHLPGAGEAGITPLALALWLGLGALFLKYQLHADNRILAASRDHGAAVDANMRSLPDLFFQAGFLLVLGPLVILVKIFQRPTYAYVSRASHYRDKLIYTAGRQQDLDPGARIVFDSKSYLLAQLLELLCWGAIFYLLLFENGVVSL